MYGCESWIVKKAECPKIDAFELWCWRRLLRVPWTARRSNQSILKEINPGCSLEGLMLKLKLQYFGHLMWRADSSEKTLILGEIWGQEEKGTTEDEMVGWHPWLDGHGFGWTPGVGDGQGGLVCCGSWGRKESDTTELLNWTELTTWSTSLSSAEAELSLVPPKAWAEQWEPDEKWLPGERTEKRLSHVCSALPLYLTNQVRLSPHGSWLTNEARAERAHRCVSHGFLSCMGWDMNIVPEGPPSSNIILTYTRWFTLGCIEKDEKAVQVHIQNHGVTCTCVWAWTGIWGRMVLASSVVSSLKGMLLLLLSSFSCVWLCATP